MRRDETAQPRGKRVLLMIGGGIAAYKSLDLIRRLRERGPAVRVVMTAAAQQFVTPLAGRRARLASRPTPTCSMPGASSTSAISGLRARPTSSWWRRPPPT